ncbi:FHA domain protein [Planctomycetes bacterium Pan216]|uniref:FHA domain protein n=1 Tax=Kolteria novifilia TaxID=2527975 RepID=A0A518B8G7_9BACT|nr:FHA domain protein [Planctomycetes bacterium Pan216]
MKAKLVPLDGGNPIELGKPILLIGRQASCDLMLEHKTVSRVHCILVLREVDLVLRDLGSTNGCRVNGQRLTESCLLHNDVLAVGAFKYRVRLDEDSIDDAPAPAERRFDPGHTECMEGSSVSPPNGSHFSRPTNGLSSRDVRRPSE